MSKIYIGQDNGVTSYFTVIFPDGTMWYEHTPIKKCLNYTKQKGYISRLDRPAYVARLKDVVADKSSQVLVLLERPMITPQRFKASISAARCMEAMETVYEELGIPYVYIDSKEWQRDLLPDGLLTDETKKASLNVGNRLFPKIPFKGDADSALIAEWGRRKNL